MGLFDFLKKKTNNNVIIQKIDEKNSQVVAMINNDNKQALSIEQAKALQDKFLALMTEEPDNKHNQMNAASTLGLSGAYAEGIEAYETLIKKYPEERGICESQIGALNFFMGKYEKAIEYYLSARSNGVDEFMVDYGVWEACETLYNKTKDKTHLEKYMQLCPTGGYTKKANKLLK